MIAQKPQRNIVPSDSRVTLDNIQSAVAKGKSLANVPEVVLDQDYLTQYRHDWCWLGAGGIPEQTGWYKVNRQNQRLEKIDDKEAVNLEWHERLFVYESAIKAAKENSALALYIGDEYNDDRLSALYLCGPDYLAWVALK